MSSDEVLTGATRCPPSCHDQKDSETVHKPVTQLPVVRYAPENSSDSDQTTHRSTVCSSFVNRFTRWCFRGPRFHTRLAKRSACPQVELSSPNLPCSPLEHISCSQSVFTVKALTFTNPARCATHALPQSRNMVLCSL